MKRFSFVVAAISLGANAILSANVPVPATGCYLSAFNETSIADHEALAKKKMAIGMFYTNWETGFPKSECDAYARNGNIPHLSWEPYRVGGDENDPAGVNENSNANIIAGKKDAYIAKYARDVKAFGKPIFIRFGLEMNGDWYEWGGRWSGADTLTGFGDPELYDGPERFVAAWRHIHDIFVKEGATNVSWVFAPNVTDEPAEPWNRLELYYPGAAYVDWLAVDGYNWGGPDWQSFDEVFADVLSRIAALGSQPIMIAEFACGEKSGNKAKWIADAYASIKMNYPRIKAVTWFDINKEERWAVGNSPDVLAAYRAAIVDPYFLSSSATDRDR